MKNKKNLIIAGIVVLSLSVSLFATGSLFQGSFKVNDHRDPPTEEQKIKMQNHKDKKDEKHEDKKDKEDKNSEGENGQAQDYSDENYDLPPDDGNFEAGEEGGEVLFPDLAVTKIVFEDDLGGGIDVELMNIGDIDVDPDSDGVVDFYLEDMESPLQSYNWSTLPNLDFLKVGGSSVLGPIEIDESTIVKVCIDWDNVDGEIDPYNNCLEVELFVPLDLEMNSDDKKI
jgi:hypothetical protein